MYKHERKVSGWDRVVVDLADAAGIPDEQLCVAEAFVRFDPEFFQYEFIELDRCVSNGDSISRIAQTVDLQSNGAFAQIFKILNDNNEKVIPYVRSGNVGNFF